MLANEMSISLDFLEHLMGENYVSCNNFWFINMLDLNDFYPDFSLAVPNHVCLSDIYNRVLNETTDITRHEMFLLIEEMFFNMRKYFPENHFLFKSSDEFELHYRSCKKRYFGLIDSYDS